HDDVAAVAGDVTGGEAASDVGAQVERAAGDAEPDGDDAARGIVGHAVDDHAGERDRRILVARRIGSGEDFGERRHLELDARGRRVDAAGGGPAAVDEGEVDRAHAGRGQ